MITFSIHAPLTWNNLHTDNYLKDNIDTSEFVYYVLMRASELYFADKSQYPGQDENINDFKVNAWI